MKKRFTVYCKAILPVELSSTFQVNTEKEALKAFREVLDTWELVPEKYLPNVRCEDFRVNEERDSAEFYVEEETADDSKKEDGTES